MARPTPVLPDVGSTITPLGFKRPSRSAASIMATAGRSLTLPPGLNSSTLASRSHESPAPTRPRRTSGVLPTRSSSDSATSMSECFPGGAMAPPYVESAVEQVGDEVHGGGEDHRAEHERQQRVAQHHPAHRPLGDVGV